MPQDTVVIAIVGVLAVTQAMLTLVTSIVVLVAAINFGRRA